MLVHKLQLATYLPKTSLGSYLEWKPPPSALTLSSRLSIFTKLSVAGSKRLSLELEVIELLPELELLRLSPLIAHFL